MSVHVTPAATTGPFTDSPRIDGQRATQGTGEPAAPSRNNVAALPPDTGDVDVQRVSELRQAIAEGRFKIDPERIADAIIASAQELSEGSGT